MSKRSTKRNLPTLHRHLVDARGKSIKQKKKNGRRPGFTTTLSEEAQPTEEAEGVTGHCRAW